MIHEIANKLSIFSHLHSKQRLRIWWIAICILAINSFSILHVFAQDESDYYEISVFLDVYKVGGMEMPSVMKDRKVYLSITDLFDFLKIKCIPSSDFDLVSGFIIKEESDYVIDRINNTIEFEGKTHHLNEGELIRTETNLFLDSKYFGEIFGLECVFNFRSLMVSLNTNLDLPIIRELRLATIHKNLKKIKEEKVADTIIERSYPLFSFGMLDWSVNSAQRLNDLSNTRASLALGSIIAGGETNIVLNYNSDQDFTEKQQYYLWRLANNDFKYVKQISAGKINPYSTSSIYDPVVGVQLTNTPTTYRRSFGSYTLSDYTKPGWTVELYVNSVLIDYVKADASGFYSFEVPLVYGNTKVTLRFYGPWGEEQTQEQNIDVPFSFVPKNELEYRVSGGFVEDSMASKYAKGELNYGIGRYMTVGGGVEYLTSVNSGNVMPFINTTVSLGGNLLFTANYTYGVMARGMLNYRFNSGLQFDVDFTKYMEGQEAINYNYSEVRKFSVTMPVRGSGFSFLSRFSINQFVLPSTQYTNAEFILSGTLFGISSNLTTFGIFSGQPKPFIYSNLSLGITLFRDYYLRPQVQYDFTNSEFISAKCEVEKRLFKFGYLTVSYEENFKSSLRNVQVGLRFDFSFAQTSLFARTGNQHTTFFETARGSFQFANKAGYINPTNRSSVGRAGLVILPFLDLNDNGIHDKNEPKVYGLEIKTSSGYVENHDNDTTIIISELEPYTNCFVEISLSNIDNIAWKINNQSLDVAVNPNQLRLIEVPVKVMGEASGMIFRTKGNSTRGQDRITIKFYNNKGKMVGSTLSERDGYYSYLGLPPGKYTVKVDPEQLVRLKMSVTPDVIPITILPYIDGDIETELDFILTEIESE